MQTLTATAQPVTCVTVLDPHFVALTAGGTLILAGHAAREVNLARQDALGVNLGDLADRTQWMRDWAFGPRDMFTAHSEYLGEASYLGETWAVFAEITWRNPVLRYVGRPRVRRLTTAVSA
jgi:hypothetical protein